MCKYVLTLMLLISGCATPAAVKHDVGAIIPPGSCYDFFVKDGLGTYQHNAQMFNPKAAFALALDPSNNHVCGYASRTEVCDTTWTTDCTWEKVEALALSRCELVRENTKGLVRTACKPFARNNQIVWEKYKNDKIDLQ